MDGLHDLGGKQGFGRVKYPSAPHNENWRPLVRALHAFAIESHIYNMDEFRHAIERMTPRHYISAPYFERHLTAIATLLIEKGIATREELESLVDGEFPLSGPLGPGRLPFAPQSFAIGSPCRPSSRWDHRRASIWDRSVFPTMGRRVSSSAATEPRQARSKPRHR